MGREIEDELRRAVLNAKQQCLQIQRSVLNEPLDFNIAELYVQRYIYAVSVSTRGSTKAHFQGQHHALTRVYMEQKYHVKSALDSGRSSPDRREFIEEDIDELGEKIAMTEFVDSPLTELIGDDECDCERLEGQLPPEKLQWTFKKHVDVKEGKSASILGRRVTLQLSDPHSHELGDLAAKLTLRVHDFFGEETSRFADVNTVVSSVSNIYSPYADSLLATNGSEYSTLRTEFSEQQGSVSPRSPIGFEQFQAMNSTTSTLNSAVEREYQDSESLSDIYQQRYDYGGLLDSRTSAMTETSAVTERTLVSGGGHSTTDNQNLIEDFVVVEKKTIVPEFSGSQESYRIQTVIDTSGAGYGRHEDVIQEHAVSSPVYRAIYVDSADEYCRNHLGPEPSFAADDWRRVSAEAVRDYDYSKYLRQQLSSDEGDYDNGYANEEVGIIHSGSNSQHHRHHDLHSYSTHHHIHHSPYEHRIHHHDRHHADSSHNRHIEERIVREDVVVERQKPYSVMETLLKNDADEIVIGSSSTYAEERRQAETELADLQKEYAELMKDDAVRELVESVNGDTDEILIGTSTYAEERRRAETELADLKKEYAELLLQEAQIITQEAETIIEKEIPALESRSQDVKTQVEQYEVVYDNVYEEPVYDKVHEDEVIYDNVADEISIAAVDAATQAASKQQAEEIHYAVSEVANNNQHLYKDDENIYEEIDDYVFVPQEKKSEEWIQYRGNHYATTDLYETPKVVYETTIRSKELEEIPLPSPKKDPAPPPPPAPRTTVQTSTHVSSLRDQFETKREVVEVPVVPAPRRKDFESSHMDEEVIGKKTPYHPASEDDHVVHAKLVQVVADEVEGKRSSSSSVSVAETVVYRGDVHNVQVEQHRNEFVETPTSLSGTLDAMRTSSTRGRAVSPSFQRLQEKFTPEDIKTSSSSSSLEDYSTLRSRQTNVVTNDGKHEVEEREYQANRYEEVRTPIDENDDSERATALTTYRIRRMSRSNQWNEDDVYEQYAMKPKVKDMDSVLPPNSPFAQSRSATPTSAKVFTFESRSQSRSSLGRSPEPTSHRSPSPLVGRTSTRTSTDDRHKSSIATTIENAHLRHVDVEKAPESPRSPRTADVSYFKGYVAQMREKFNHMSDAQPAPPIYHVRAKSTTNIHAASTTSATATTASKTETLPRYKKSATTVEHSDTHKARLWRTIDDEELRHKSTTPAHAVEEEEIRGADVKTLRKSYENLSVVGIGAGVEPQLPSPRLPTEHIYDEIYVETNTKRVNGMTASQSVSTTPVNSTQVIGTTSYHHSPQTATHAQEEDIRGADVKSLRKSYENLSVIGSATVAESPKRTIPSPSPRSEENIYDEVYDSNSNMKKTTETKTVTTVYSQSAKQAQHYEAKIITTAPEPPPTSKIPVLSPTSEIKSPTFTHVTAPVITDDRNSRIPVPAQRTPTEQPKAYDPYAESATVVVPSPAPPTPVTEVEAKPASADQSLEEPGQLERNGSGRRSWTVKTYENNVNLGSRKLKMPDAEYATSNGHARVSPERLDGQEATVLQNWNPKKLVRALYAISYEPRVETKRNRFINIEGHVEMPAEESAVSELERTWRSQYLRTKEGRLQFFVSHSAEEDAPATEVVLSDADVDANRDERTLYIHGGREKLKITIRVPSTVFDKWRQALLSHTASSQLDAYVRPIPKSLPCSGDRVLVLELGSCSIRGGVLTKEPTLPQSFFPSIAVRTEDGKIIVGEDAYAPEVRHRGEFVRPIQASDPAVERYTIDKDVVRACIEKVVRDLNLSPRDYKVQLSVPQNIPTPVIADLLSTVLNTLHFQAAAITRQPSLILYAYDAATGVVVDIGDRLNIVPVIDGYVVESAICSIPYGATQVREALRKSLCSKNNGLYSFQSPIEKLILRYVMEQTAYVPEDYEKESARGVKDVNVSLAEFDPTPSMETSFNIDTSRFVCTEGLFRPKKWGLDTKGLHQLIHDAIQMSPIDSRRTLYKNIFLAGGASLLPGLAEKLETELATIVPNTIHAQVHISPWRYNAAYLGAQILASSSTFGDRCVTPENLGKFLVALQASSF